MATLGPTVGRSSVRSCAGGRLASALFRLNHECGRSSILEILPLTGFAVRQGRRTDNFDAATGSKTLPSAKRLTKSV